MLAALRLLPRGVKPGSPPDLPRYGDHLLATQNAKQANQRDKWRSWRADMEEAVDDSDKNAGSEGQDVWLHGLSLFWQMLVEAIRPHSS
jgi:hypothetical protein